jgi:3-phytase
MRCSAPSIASDVSIAVKSWAGRACLFLATVWLTACGPGQDKAGDAPHPLLQEAWVSQPDESMNIDSVAFWAGPGGERWVIATAKATHVLRVLNAETGALVRDVGGPGDEPGQFLRPNGIAVVDDLVFVVERDNRRVQALSLPDFRPLATFGSDMLRYPYGLWVGREGDGYRLFVTDNYETSAGGVPPLEALGERVHHWLVRVDRDTGGQPVGMVSRHLKAFGETSGEGALRIVESLWADPRTGRLLIAEEDEAARPDARTLKVYDLAGRFTGVMIGAGVFVGQTEGIALRECGSGGQWIVADQGKDRNWFRIFDRNSLEYLGSFGGETTLNTDGIWYNGTPLERFSGGVLYAVHDDMAVAAFDWAEVAQLIDGMESPADCR